MTKAVKKTSLLIILMLCTSAVFSQAQAKLKTIDSVVTLINSGGFTIQRDTIRTSPPGTGISAETRLETVVDGKELKKYVNDVHVTTEEGGEVKQLHATTRFYFDKGKLIKVEESAVEGNKKMNLAWYYSEGQAIYYTLKSDKAKDRAEFLLKMAKTLLDTIKF